MTKRPKAKMQSNPLQEAILEVRFSLDKWDITSAGRLYEKLAKDFPVKQNVQSLAFFIGPAEGTQSPKTLPAPQAPVMQLWKEDRSKLIQFGPGLVVANELRYSNWADFVKTLDQVTAGYIAVVKPSSVSRISARYINRFELPRENLDLGEHFTCNVELPQTLPEVEQLQLQIVSPAKQQGGREYRIKVIFGTVPGVQPENPALISFLLDIECFSVTQLDPTITEITAHANHLHDSVKEVFSSFLGPKLKNKFLLKG